jgi:hypothetical protein
MISDSVALQVMEVGSLKVQVDSARFTAPSETNRSFFGHAFVFGLSKSSAPLPASFFCFEES